MYNYFKILQIEENASIDEIKKNYYLLAKEYHPDKNQSDYNQSDYNQSDNNQTNNDEIFKLINEAYHVLINDKKRKEYIDLLKKNRKTPIVKLNINVSLDKIYLSRELNIDIPINILGEQLKENITIPINQQVLSKGFFLENKGDEILNHSRGDLNINLIVENNPKWEFNFPHLIHHLEISLEQAQYGDRIIFKHIDNQEIPLKLNPLKHSQEKLIIKNLGFNGIGDLIIHFKILF